MGWGGVGRDGVWWGLSAGGLSVALAVMVCYQSYEKLSHRRRIAPIGHYRTSIGHYRTIGHYRSTIGVHYRTIGPGLKRPYILRYFHCQMSP